MAKRKISKVKRRSFEAMSLRVYVPKVVPDKRRKIAEGVVFKVFNETSGQQIRSFKVINNKFLLSEKD